VLPPGMAEGTVQMVGSGLKPRRTGFWKVGIFHWVNPPLEVGDVLFLQYDNVDVLLFILGLL
jgi:hypothetical protein